MNNEEKTKRKLNIITTIFYISIAAATIGLILAISKGTETATLYGWIFVIGIITAIITNKIRKNTKQQYNNIKTISMAIKDNKNKD